LSIDEDHDKLKRIGHSLSYSYSVSIDEDDKLKRIGHFVDSTSRKSAVKTDCAPTHYREGVLISLP